MKKNNHYPYYEMPEIRDFRHLVNFMRETYPEKDVFMFEKNKKDVTVSYPQFAADIDALSVYFAQMGLKNEKIALYAENSYEWIITYFAAICSDNVIVPIDKEITGVEVKNLVNDCEAKVLVHIAKVVFSNLHKPSSTNTTSNSTLENKGKNVYGLTDRELDVLSLMVDGLSNPQIAEKLIITRATAKAHVHSILQKLCASTRTQATVTAMKEGLV